MAQKHKDDWQAWHLERSDFLERDSEGFTKDLKALEQHIKNLTAVCPKDETGWPVSHALIHIGRLQRDHARFKEYLQLNRSEK